MLAGLTTSGIGPPVVNRHQSDKLLIVGRNPNNVPLIVQASAGQSSHLQNWNNSSGTVLAYVDSSGVFNGNGSGLTSLTPDYVTFMSRFF